MNTEKWEYGSGGLIDLCNGCRFEKAECPVAQGEIDFIPGKPKDRRNSISIKGNYFRMIKGLGAPINPFVCVIFEPRGISGEVSLLDSSSQER